MRAVSTSPERRVLTRDEAIEALRAKLLTMTDEEHSACSIAARKGIFCRGFAQWRDEEFRNRFEGVASRRPGVDRHQLERLANTWQLARQIVSEVPLQCDLQQAVHETCLGWDGFTNDDLTRYCGEILGEPVLVVDGPPPPRDR